jgi:hypothetical protein
MSQVIPLRRGRLPYYSIRPPWRQAGRSASLVRGWQFGGAAPGRALVRGAWRQGAVPGTRQGAYQGAQLRSSWRLAHSARAPGTPRYGPPGANTGRDFSWSRVAPPIRRINAAMAARSLTSARPSIRSGLLARLVVVRIVL